MSQHDMTVDNQARSAVRADINLALQALASTSKGPNAPSAPVQGQLWIDDNTPSSSNWTLSVYDGADWIALGTINTSTNTFTVANLPSGVPTGTIVAFAGPTEPSGWSFCDGTALGRVAEAALFAVIGTAFGAGDGSTTFAKPDLRGRFAAGRDTMGGGAAGRITTAGGVDGATLGAAGGNQLTATLIAHVHAAWRIIATVLNQDYSQHNGIDPPVNMLTDTSFDMGGATGSAGSGGSLPIMPPTLVVNYIIKK